MAIAVHGITKRFGDFVALEDVSVEIPEGSLTALLGPSGSGKSTLLRVIAGLERPDSGIVAIGGRDVTSLPRRHDETGTTTVIVTHDQEEAMEVAERIVVVNRGRIEQVAGPRELYERPANEFVMSFVGPVNRLGDEWVRPHDVALSLDQD